MMSKGVLEDMRERVSKYADICNRCRCGFCREGCPTFKIKKMESFGPRGRMSLVWAAFNNIIEYTDNSFIEKIFSCATCAQCKERCPNDVDVPLVMEYVRYLIWKEKR